MPYSHLDHQGIQDADLRKVFEHADDYLHDVYGMLRLLPPPDRDGGGGNFAASLVLLCVVDGLARIWPGSSAIKDPEKRFKKLIERRLHWGPEGNGKWLHKGTAADQLYAEFRNPLVHELGSDKSATSRLPGYEEPIIGTWGGLPDELQNVGAIDRLEAWNDQWPILGDAPEPDENGKPRLKLTIAGLYWAVKRLTVELLEECKSGQSKHRVTAS